MRVTAFANRKQRERTVDPTREDPRQVEAALLLELGSSSRSARAAPSFSDLCIRSYQPHAQLHLGARTWNRTRRYQVIALADHFGLTPLDRLTDAQVEAFIATQRAKGCADSSINHDLRVLKTILRFAKARGYAVPALTIKPLRIPQGRVHAWTLDELTALLERARTTSPRLWPILVFLANTGCRKGESIAAQWSWVDFPGGMLRIPATRYWRPKSGRAREVPLSTSLRSLLEQQPRESLWLFPRARDGKPRAVWPLVEFTRLRKAARLTGGPHTFRHTFASLFLRSKPDLPLLARLMGHSTTKITELYAHMLPGHLDEARDVVDVGVSDDAPDGRRGALRGAARAVSGARR